MIRLRPLRESFCAACVGALFGLLPVATVRADVAPDGPSPVVAACANKKAGESCDFYGKPGTCVGKPCNTLDYSKGSPPEVIESECIECAEVAADAPPIAPPTASAPLATPVAPPSAAETAGRCRIDPTNAPALLLLIAFLRRRRG